jgi:hypothetical protein
MSSYDFIDPDKPSSTSTETESPLQAPTHGPPFEEPKENQMLELEEYPELRYRALCFKKYRDDIRFTEIDSDSDKVGDDPSFFKELKFRLKTLYRNLR